MKHKAATETQQLRPRTTAEENRLAESRAREKHWKRWGPYLSERAWGTVREDYSSYGSAWDYFPHEHARSKAYRWGEDGLAGISDRQQHVCFSLALWNGRDPFLKERLFGLTGSQGNHGEDVKEYYFYLDATPSHSYQKFLYKYPQGEFPYQQLIEENQRLDKRALEFELLDTGIFDDNRYFDVFVEYAKAAPEDILIQITVVNRGPSEASIDLLPTIWFRNTWSWGTDERRPQMRQAAQVKSASVIELEHWYLGQRRLFCDRAPSLLFTENETNKEKLYGATNDFPYVKDGINDYLVHGRADAVNPAHTGTKAAAHYHLTLSPGESKTIKLRLTDDLQLKNPFAQEFEQIVAERLREADEFYDKLAPAHLSTDARNVQRQAFAGLLWSKQFYHYDLNRWLTGDPANPAPPTERWNGRNKDWGHLYNADVISMPDKWEYPWYAAWDLAFHCIPLAQVDPDFAKEQLILMLREWYMHPNGQIPAYEWAFGDVNPPVHAWAAWRVYKIEQRQCGHTGDRKFLERVFHKLLLNFNWWVNRKDAEGKNIFQGGFLGLDNIGVFDRSAALPTGGHLHQSDATSWMGMYCLNMLTIALELAKDNQAYEDVASKFFEHFVYICHAMNHVGCADVQLWDEQDGFYYDVLHLPNGEHFTMRVRSLVGLIPLFAVETLDEAVLNNLPGFKKRLQWFIENRPEFAQHVESEITAEGKTRYFLSLVNRDRLRRVLQLMLDEDEFLSPYGIRAVSRFHAQTPYVLNVNGTEHRVDYEPAESSTGLFGGNSNWRGPIWFPVNYLLVESLQKFHHFLGDEYQVEFPARSGDSKHLWDVAGELSRRMTRIFLRDGERRRPVYGGTEKFQHDPHWNEHVLFHEYFHGDNGAGIGASHQTGWTALVAKLIQQNGE